jgi:PAS domain S-box-containing protein
MSEPLNVLIIEDSESDAALAVRLLGKAGYDVHDRRVETAGEMQAALQEQTWDVVICDYRLPQFDAPAALAVLQATGLDIPFIVVSGTIGEESVVAMMKAGAHDYLMKDRLMRLAPAVERELREAHVRRERKQAEEALAQEQYLMQALMDNIPDYIYFKDRESRFIRINKAHAQSFGLNDPVQAVGKTDFDFFTEEHARSAYEDEQRIFQTGQPMLNIEEKETRPDRPDAWVSTTKMLLRDKDGHLAGTFGISRDITERKRAEEALRESATRLSTIFRVSPAPIAISRLNGNQFVDVNEAFQNITGCSRAEIVGHTPRELNLWVEPEQRDRLISELRARRRVRDFEFRLQRKSGAIHDMLMSAELVELAGESCVLTIALDITERKRAEEALRALSNRQEALLAAIPDIITEVNNDKVYTWANQAGLEFFGQDAIGQEAAFYFEGEQDTYAVVQPLFNGSEDTIYVESWQRRKDGQKRLLAWWCRVLKDDRGNPIGALSSARDITERKQMEEALYESEKRYHDIFENATEGIFQSTPDGRYLSVNPALARMYGFSSPEEIMREVQDIAHQLYANPQERQEIKRLLQGPGAVKGFEVELRRKDGTPLWGLINARAVRDASGNVLYYEGTTQDITERKQAETKIKEQLAELERWYNVMLDREGRALQLKAEVNQLLRRLGEPIRYPSVGDSKGLQI